MNRSPIRRKEYLRGSGSSMGPGDGFSKPADSSTMGYVNNSFVYDVSYSCKEVGNATNDILQFLGG